MMSKHGLQLGAVALGLAASSGLATSARADQAIVVGINRYPNLETKWQLEGCVNDAKDVASVLERYGFKVKVLTDDQASREGLLKVLRAAKRRVRDDERFVFYFAGHGSRTDDDRAALCPADT